MNIDTDAVFLTVTTAAEAAGSPIALARIFSPGGTSRVPLFMVPEDEWKLIRDVVAANVVGDYETEIELARKILRVACQGALPIRRLLGQMLSLANKDPKFPESKKLGLIAAAYDVYQETKVRAAAFKWDFR